MLGPPRVEPRLKSLPQNGGGRSARRSAEMSGRLCHDVDRAALITTSARRKAPPLQKPQEWGTQLQRPNFKGEENRGSGKASGLSRILAPAAGNITARPANRVYNAGNLFAGSRFLLNDCAIWRHDGDSCSK